MNLRGDKRHS
ncbi:hypothetical protein AZE42_13271 [Rhizopogon vesiculosus]|uniref:Uncharacterized protein n=1 Tax=Rhizopogon vesiculosus TaxID=180088 RepID=A0A1J8RE58_9AGAM|nr:hypothetical protein AZE42_13271 [Rhizopogon vesiculosus]